MIKQTIKRLKPTLVLGTITTVVGALLIIKVNLLPDTSGMITERLREACVSLMGEGEYIIIEDWEGAGYAISKPEPNQDGSINKLILKDDGMIAFEITTGGFAPPDGITVLVAMNPDQSDGVLGVIPVMIKDTPGFGDRTYDPDFLAGFVGAHNPLTMTRTPTDSADEVMGITGATFSAQGVVDAVNIAIEIYGQLGVQ